MIKSFWIRIDEERFGTLVFDASKRIVRPSCPLVAFFRSVGNEVLEMIRLRK